MALLGLLSIHDFAEKLVEAIIAAHSVAELGVKPLHLRLQGLAARIRLANLMLHLRKLVNIVALLLAQLRSQLGDLIRSMLKLNSAAARPLCLCSKQLDLKQELVPIFLQLHLLIFHAGEHILVPLALRARLACLGRRAVLDADLQGCLQLLSEHRVDLDL